MSAVWRKTITLSAAGAASMLLLGGSANAETFTCGWGTGNNGNYFETEYDIFSQSDGVTDNGNGTETWYGSTTNIYSPEQGGGEWSLDWNMTKTSSTESGNGYELVTADLAITNLSPVRQEFWALVSLNLDNPIVGGSITNGSISTSVTDLLGDAHADITTINQGQFQDDPIYAAYVDGTGGAPAKTMFEAPFLLETNTAFDTEVNGDSFVGDAGPASANSIHVWIKVELSAFDQANLIGTFEIAPVPAPGALALLGLAGLAGTRRRRG